MQESNEHRNPFLLAPSLMPIVLLFFGVFSFIPFGKGALTYILASVLMIFVLGGMLALAVYLRGSRWLKVCCKSRSKGGFLLSLAASGMMMIQSALIRAFLIGDLYDYRTYSLYGMSFESATDSFGAFLLVFTALAVVPAFLEGFLFRGFFMYEYRHAGIFLSVLVPSFLYAMTGMSVAQYPVHLLNGILLSSVVFLTGNVFYSILSHLLYALFALTLEKYFLFIAAETPLLFLLVLAAVGLFFIICFCGLADKILRLRGENEDRVPIRCKKGKLSVVLKDIFSVPMIWADVFGFLLIGVLHIFLDA